MTFYQTYRKAIISGLITACIAGGVPGLVWLHNAYADDRYVKQDEAIQSEIRQYNAKIYECQQEADLAKTQEERSKWLTRKLYYENEKEDAIRRLEQKKN